jgi:exodeoxyribonuclease VII large subunit
MTDFYPDSAFDGGPAPGNVPEFSVSEISMAVKRTLEGTFERVRVRGEISGFKRAASGHLYMALKDENAVLDAVCWRGTAGKLSLAPEDGMEVIATGRLTSYPGRSKYQIVVEALELAGEGALLKLLEDRRRKLAAEGLFDAERKRALPFLPEVIGVVTSPTGAVIRDILHRLADRFPRRVLVWPVLVQGEGAAQQVAAAIRGFNALPAGGAALPRPDLLIVARGGGSLEDLWAFNEEIVVRAAAESAIPLISAVGHETDTTLIDYAADRRAPTPTAAAEMAVPVRRELLIQTGELERRLLGAAARMVAERRVQLEGLGRGLVDPKRLLEDMSQRLDDRAERLRNCWNAFVRDRQARVDRLRASLPHPRQLLAVKAEQLAGPAGRLDTLRPRLLGDRRRELDGLKRVLDSVSYENVLKRGYAVVLGPEGVITRPEGVTPGLALKLKFASGSAAATGGADQATSAPAEKPAAKPTAPRKKSSSDDPQGSLL